MIKTIDDTLAKWSDVAVAMP